MSPNAPTLPPHLARYAAIAGDVRAFAEALQRPLPQTLHTNTERLSPERLAELLEGVLSLTPLSWRTGAFRLAPEDRPGRHWSFTSGLFSVQEEASLLPVAMLDVRPGQRVLDLCAAPGNKTAQIALALGNRGTVLANDLKTGRLSALHDLTRRLGLVNVSTTGHDGCVYPVADGSFDRILVDAPCTAEGKARRGYLRDSPPAFRRWVTGQQRGLLRRAAQLLRPGGRMVYSTCTFAPEENEAVVADVLDELGGELSVVAPAAELPGSSPGLTEWEGRHYGDALAQARRLWPHLADTGGFFAVALQRRGEGTIATTDDRRFGGEATAGLRAQFERFRIGADTLDRVAFLEDDRHLRVVAADHAVPSGITVENIGVDVARRRARETKLSTPGAMAIAQHAMRNVVVLDAGEFVDWRSRRDLTLESGRVSACTRGAVLVRHAGLVHGTAFLRIEDDGSGRLESQYPKAWMLGELNSERG
ncbi:MAG: RsmB/NOP family class I SAM-dependent RNA methyltransferase [Pseudomonadales bacterium]|jgi:16S rRNA C967 or C1407 C5-methylase (RsmB/RsmF family)/NOL1/NOP2/fmu family ribosome biogenesis protein|nr:RsmB/NOP family class I SAM-dependent RNA methyltransferase [Pseudomonadales bacterium]